MLNSFCFCPFFTSFIKANNNNPWNLVPTYQSILSNGAIGEKSFIETPNDNTNLFARFSTSFLAVYFMLTGDTSAVSSWVLQDDWILAFLLVAFLFFTTIYLLNLFISLLSITMEKKDCEEIFLQTKAEKLFEIELFWMLPHQKTENLKDEKNNEILQDLLPEIQKIVEAKDSTKDSNEGSTDGSAEDSTKDSNEDSTDGSAEDSPYGLIARDLSKTKDSTKDSTYYLVEG
ncbi:24637_t:CDS:2, partial [Racocetra persica]